MFKISLFLLFGFLALASTSDPTLTKTFFFVGQGNFFSPTSFYVNNKVLAYNSWSANNPGQIIQMDYEAGSLTTILTDLSSYCDNDNLYFGKLHYHVSLTILVYYCAKNDTLLILDKDNYSVENQVPINVTGKFSETRLYTAGNSIVVLRTQQDLQRDKKTSPSEIIKIDLLSRTVTNHLVISQGISDTEIVNAFASSDKGAYILTRHVSSPNIMISLYSLAFIGNTYQVTLLTAWTEDYRGDHPVNQLYCFGNYIVTNNFYNLMFLSNQGETIYNYPNLAYNQDIDLTTFGPYLVMPDGGNQLYALFSNNSLVLFSVYAGSVITTKVLANAGHMQIALGADNLLLALSPDFVNFTITDLQTWELLYSTIATYDDFMITNTTYGVTRRNSLYIFNISDNSLIANVSITPTNYHEQDAGLFYFLNTSSKDTCDLICTDLQTAETKVVYSLNNSKDCSGQILNMRTETPGSPDFLIKGKDYYLFVTQAYGQATFIPPFDKVLSEVVIPNFDSMAFEYLMTTFMPVTVTLYTYVYQPDKGFIVQAHYDLDQVLENAYYSIGDNKVIGVSKKGEFTLFDLPNADNVTNYSFKDDDSPVMTTFHDNDNNLYVIFSEVPPNPMFGKLRINPPYLLEDGNLSLLYGINNLTYQAGAAGLCSYWVVDEPIIGNGVGLVKFYNVCNDSEEKISTIYQ